MDLLKRFLFLSGLLCLTGCQIGYLLKSARSQFSIITHRVPIEEALRDPSLSPTEKSKLSRALEAHAFALAKMNLKETANYTTFVKLDRPYVTYALSAAPRWKLEHYEWSYPIVGKMPYRGYAAEEDGKAEQALMEKEDFDTYLRGVSAYSTLGWFKDPVLSSMLRMSEHDLVNTVIHETTHTTLYIHGSADFNERLAVFTGNEGTEEFYRAKEGEKSATLKEIRDDNYDDTLFSSFIGPEIAELKKWYEALPEKEHREELRQERFSQIQAKFKSQIYPKMKTTSYKGFPDLKLNNARLLYYRTYMQDLSDFRFLFDHVGKSWPQFLACAKTLEKSEKPEDDLKKLNARLEKENVQLVCAPAERPTKPDPQ